MAVTLSPSHGGCGATHSRSVTHGAPAKHWALDCPACENHLRSDPSWSTTISEIPETPDEQRERESREKKGQLNQQDLLAQAIVSIAQSQQSLPDALAQAIAALAKQGGIPAEVTAAATHQVEAAKTAAAAEATVSNTDVSLDLADLKKLKVPELRALAEERGLDPGGKRDELLSRLTGETVEEIDADLADGPPEED